MLFGIPCVGVRQNCENSAFTTYMLLTIDKNVKRNDMSEIEIQHSTFTYTSIKLSTGKCINTLLTDFLQKFTINFLHLVIAFKIIFGI